MIPAILDPAHVRMALVGAGPLGVKRLRQLRELGADLTVYSPDPDGEFADLAGPDLVRALPSPQDIGAVHLLYVVGFENDVAAPLAAEARRQRVLVNVEDVIPLCDFHMPSLVKRGDLLMTVSTRGRSPALARSMREALERLFPEVWAERLAEIAAMRDRMKAEGADGAAIMRATKEFIRSKDWLPKGWLP